jgi:hypothetical protein
VTGDRLGEVSKTADNGENAKLQYTDLRTYALKALSLIQLISNIVINTLNIS